MSELRGGIVTTIVLEIFDERMNKVNSFIGHLLQFLSVQLLYSNSDMSIKGAHRFSPRIMLVFIRMANKLLTFSLTPSIISGLLL
jgi:hypothetical protein